MAQSGNRIEKWASSSESCSAMFGRMKQSYGQLQDSTGAGDIQVSDAPNQQGAAAISPTLPRKTVLACMEQSRRQSV